MDSAHCDVTVAITAHPKRNRMANDLAIEIKADAVVWDLHNRGCEPNSIVTFEYLKDCDTEWAARLEDDVLAVRHFQSQLSQVLAVAPSPVVSLYLGRGRPISHDGVTGWQDRISAVILQEACWIMSPRLLSAQGMVIKTELIEPMLETIRLLVMKMPLDDAISQWCMAEGLQVAHCRPSIVDHREVPTVIKNRHDGQQRTEIRKAWLFDSRKHWDSSSVSLLSHEG